MIALLSQLSMAHRADPLQQTLPIWRCQPVSVGPILR
jgi:hypothetical protein